MNMEFNRRKRTVSTARQIEAVSNEKTKGTNVSLNVIVIPEDAGATANHGAESVLS